MLRLLLLLGEIVIAVILPGGIIYLIIKYVVKKEGE